MKARVCQRKELRTCHMDALSSRTKYISNEKRFDSLSLKERRQYEMESLSDKKNKTNELEAKNQIALDSNRCVLETK